MPLPGPTEIAHPRSMGDIVWFDELRASDVDSAGGKGANLGELTHAEFPVPPGFVVTAQAYLQAMDDAGVRSELAEVAAGVDPDDATVLAATSDRLQELVRKAGVPAALRARVLEAYEQLGGGRVAVRSSATSEDTAAASFAGMNQTFTNVTGAEQLLSRLVDCWASLFGARVVAYRRARGVTDEPAIAVVVQTMVASERSGVMFTADPTTDDESHIVIEGAFGLGEVVVGGQVEPDTYVVAKQGPRLVDVRVGTQTHAIFSDPANGDQRVAFTAAEGGRRVLADDEVLALAELGMRVEAHYERPQDVEWAIAGGETYLVQSRPITTLHAQGPRRPRPKDRCCSTASAHLRTPRAARCECCSRPPTRARFVSGEVLVAPMTNPDWVPVLRKAAALVTDGGGMTCHAAIVSRELGVPCVVGTRKATAVLRDGELVTVDGTKGVVIAGTATPAITGVERPPLAVATTGAEALATLVYVNLAIADHAEQVAAQPVDGVGLLRAEFMIDGRTEGRAPAGVAGTGRTRPNSSIR